MSYAYARSNLTHADNMYVIARVHYRIMPADSCLHCNLCEAMRVYLRLELTLFILANRRRHFISLVVKDKNCSLFDKCVSHCIVRTQPLSV